MPTAIATGFGALSMTTMNGRHVDVDSSGRRWIANGGTFYYSANGSSAWTVAAGVVTIESGSPVAFFIDIDDGFHIVYKNAAGTTSYRYGTESGGTITWSSELTRATVGTGIGSCDIVAHKFGSDYYAHLLYDENNQVTLYSRVKVTGGTPVWDGSEQQFASLLATSRFASIALRHTGDGKTVGASPDVFAMYGWEASVAFRKLSYAAGPTWTAGVQQSVSGVSGGGNNGVITFDSVACQMSFRRNDNKFALIERDVADTTNTSRATVSAAGTGYPSIAYDADRNVYLAATDSALDPVWNKWDRDTGLWDTWTTVAAVTAYTGETHLLRNRRSGALEVVYVTSTDGKGWWDQPLVFPSTLRSGWGMIPIGGV